METWEQRAKQQHFARGCVFPEQEWREVKSLLYYIRFGIWLILVCIVGLAIGLGIRFW
jgi:hypothetical protein